jgi:TRAP-type uncharacterized transport system fused permease subunit
VISAIIGVICLAAGLMGYLRSPCSWWERCLLVIAALLLIKPGYVSDAIGLAVLAALLLLHSARSRVIARGAGK